MKKTKRILGASVLVLAVLVAAGARLGALPQSGYHKDYFDESGYWVGEDNLFCDGGRYTEGQETPFVSGFTEPCSTGEPGSGPKECFIILYGNTVHSWSCW